MPTNCYCCDRESTSVEHVPPKCLFPAKKDAPNGVNLRRNLITVPSCHMHNQEKAGDDEYLLYVLSMAAPSGRGGFEHFSSKVSRAMDRRPALARSFLARSRNVEVAKAGAEANEMAMAVQEDGARLQRSLELIAFGLYRHHTGKRWRGRIKVVPEFMHFIEDEKADEWNEIYQKTARDADQLFANAPLQGENPTVFRYQILIPEPDQPCAVRMHFYDNTRVTALLLTDA